MTFVYIVYTIVLSLFLWTLLFVTGVVLCAFFQTPEPLKFETEGFTCACNYHIGGVLVGDTAENFILIPFRILYFALKFRFHTKKCLAFIVNYGMISKRWIK
jgi:hypothetical protein